MWPWERVAFGYLFYALVRYGTGYPSHRTG